MTNSQCPVPSAQCKAWHLLHKFRGWSLVTHIMSMLINQHTHSHTHTHTLAHRQTCAAVAAFVKFVKKFFCYTRRNLNKIFPFFCCFFLGLQMILWGVWWVDVVDKSQHMSKLKIIHERVWQHCELAAGRQQQQQHKRSNCCCCAWPTWNFCWSVKMHAKWSTH